MKTAVLAVFFYTSQEEQDEFESSFDDLATQIVDGFHANALLRVQVLDMLAISLTSTAMATQQKWPMVTFEDFEARATAARAIAKSDFLELYPYVTNETRKAWEQYTMNNTHWLEESFAFQKNFKETHNRTVGPRAPARSRRLVEEQQQEGDQNHIAHDSIRNVTFNGTDGISPEIYRYGSEEEGFDYVVCDGPGPYYPMWQTSPAREYSAIDVNYNVYDTHWPGPYTKALEIARIEKTAIFGGVWNVDETGYISEDDDYDFRTVPAGTLFYPVFEDASASSARTAAQPSRLSQLDRHAHACVYTKVKDAVGYVLI